MDDVAAQIQALRAAQGLVSITMDEICQAQLLITVSNWSYNS